MRKQHLGSSDPLKTRPTTGPEIDYSPKNYSWGQSLLFGGILIAIAAVFFLLLWIADKL